MMGDFVPRSNAHTVRVLAIRGTKVLSHFVPNMQKWGKLSQFCPSVSHGKG